MPKKRTSTAPLRLRTRIDTTGRINEELRRTYRLFINKEITHADMTRRRELLVALRAGMSDPVEQPKAAETPAAMSIVTIIEGNAFTPGGPDDRILLPFDLAGESWAAHNGGVETWKTYLTEIEPMLTKAQIERLSRVPALDRAKVLSHEEPRLHLVPPAPEPTEDIGTRLEAALSGMSTAEIRSMTMEELLEKTGWDRELDPDDAA